MGRFWTLCLAWLVWLLTPPATLVADWLERWRQKHEPAAPWWHLGAWVRLLLGKKGLHH
jgi:hypothetical protein